MNRRTFLRTGALLLAAGALIAGNGLVSAHEHRTVGDYTFVVGFLNEPAVQDELNAASVRITKPAPADATPAPGEEEVAETPVKDAGADRRSQSSAIRKSACPWKPNMAIRGTMSLLHSHPAGRLQFPRDG